MEIWRGPEQVPAGVSSVVTIGNFDGVHLGHQQLLAGVVEQARLRGCLAVAMTFFPHPYHVHVGPLPLITSLADRLEALESCGLDAVLVVDYNLEFAAQGPREFVSTWVKDLLGARAVIVGQDVRFGAGNSGDIDTLRELGREFDFEVLVQEEVCGQAGKRWSSTWVRQLLAEGNVMGVAQVLGRAHRVRGVVVDGAQRGRDLGFPTANLLAAHVGEVPQDGVYAGWLLRPSVRVDGAPERLPAAISVGTNPTFEDVNRTVEAHVLGRADLNLYGEEVVVEMVERIRPMLTFTSIGPLIDQMHDDVARAATILGVPRPGPIDPAAVTARPAAD
ncbi:MAG: bifunctional riboflavin kinase/FAD synthetase [Buchananella hordeovulneris]|nr:bifunctional riboflavin kinase/FAD synthetase [Buchananella hordeovulneris]